MNRTERPPVLEMLRWDEAREAARAVRYAVFCIEQGIPKELEWDDWDASCWHCLARDATGQPSGTGRLLPDGHIGRMAVLEPARRGGLGAAILHALMAQARKDGLPEVVLNAQQHAEGFYARHGFAVRGAPYVEAGIVHVTMHCTLA